MFTHLLEYTYSTGLCLQLVHADLTQEKVDAIVNAANSRLLHGGGVAGAIVGRGGMRIQVESDAWVREHGPVTHDRPAYTSAGSLPCRYVIHAVGPVWGEGHEDAKLAAAVKGSLSVADELQLKSMSLPAISTGIFGFPKARAAQVILAAIHEYFTCHPGSGLQLVRIALLDEPTIAAFTNVWNRFFHSSQ